MRTFPGLLGIGEIADLRTQRALLEFERWAEQVRLPEVEPIVRKLTLNECDTGIDKVYNNLVTTGNSQTFSIAGSRSFTYLMEITKANAPTSIQFFIEFSDDASDWYVPSEAAYSPTITAATIGAGYKGYVHGPLAASYMRLRSLATGTTAADTITVGRSALYLGD